MVPWFIQWMLYAIYPDKDWANAMVWTGLATLVLAAIAFIVGATVPAWPNTRIPFSPDGVTLDAEGATHAAAVRIFDDDAADTTPLLAAETSSSERRRRQQQQQQQSLAMASTTKNTTEHTGLRRRVGAYNFML